MKAIQKLLSIQQQNQSRLCIGLDTEYSKLPKHLLDSDNPIKSFNNALISSTKKSACAYKINTAFYEQYGVKGWDLLKDTVQEISNEQFIIADAKRADIGNTSAAYARAFFQDMQCDAITVNPYMGYDSLAPFLEWEDKMVIVLALTSNPGSKDFQRLISDGKPMYQHVIETVLSWKSNADIGFVVGATHPDELLHIRSIAPHAPLLIPGVGAQGGDVDAIKKANGTGVMMVNVSRGIQYAGDSIDYQEKAHEAAEFYRKQIGYDA